MQVFFQYSLLSIGVAASIAVLVGLYYSFVRNQQSKAITCAVIGFLGVLLATSFAWIAYDYALELVRENLMLGLHYAMEYWLRAIYASTLPFLLSLLLLARWFMKASGDTPIVYRVMMGICAGLSTGFFSSALLAHADFSIFTFVLIRWMAS